VSEPGYSPRSLRVAGAIYGGLLAALSCLHALMLKQPYGQDLAYFTQLSWSVAHGRGFRQTAIAHERASGLVDLTHFVPGLALWSPLQWVAPGPFALQILQGTLWGLGLIPMVRLCAAAGGHRHWGLFGGLLYALHPLGLSMALMDFRAGVIAAPLLLFCLDFLRRGRPGAAVVCALAAAAGREDVVVTLAALAPLSWALAGRPMGGDRGSLWRARLEAAAWPIAAAAAWAAVVVAARGQLSSFAGQGHLREAWESFRLSPAIWQALPVLLAPVLPTALLAPEALAPVGVVLFGVYVLAQRTVDPQLDIGMHYFAVFAPLLILGACLGAGRLLRLLRRLTITSELARWGLMGGLLVCAAATVPWGAANTRRVPSVIQHHMEHWGHASALLTLARVVPPDAAVIANDRILPLLAARDHAVWPDPPAGALYREAMAEATWALVVVGQEAKLPGSGWELVGATSQYMLMRREPGEDPKR